MQQRRGKSGLLYKREGCSEKAENGSSMICLGFPNQNGQWLRINTPETV